MIAAGAPGSRRLSLANHRKEAHAAVRNEVMELACAVKLHIEIVGLNIAMLLARFGGQEVHARIRFSPELPQRLSVISNVDVRLAGQQSSGARRRRRQAA